MQFRSEKERESWGRYAAAALSGSLLDSMFNVTVKREEALVERASQLADKMIESERVRSEDPD